MRRVGAGACLPAPWFLVTGVAGRDEHPPFSCTVGLVILASSEALPTETVSISVGFGGTWGIHGSRDGVEMHLSLSLCPSAILIIVFCIVTVLGKDALAQGEWWALFILIGSAVMCTVVTVIIWQQPESKTKLSFKVSGSARRALRGPSGTTQLLAVRRGSGLPECLAPSPQAAHPQGPLMSVVQGDRGSRPRLGGGQGVRSLDYGNAEVVRP